MASFVVVRSHFTLSSDDTFKKVVIVKN